MTILDWQTWIPRDQYSCLSVSLILHSLSPASPLLSHTPAAPYTPTNPCTFPPPTTPHTPTTNRHLTFLPPQPPHLPPVLPQEVAHLHALSNHPPWVRLPSLFSDEMHHSSAPCPAPIPGPLLLSMAGSNQEEDHFGRAVEEARATAGRRGRRVMGSTEENMPPISWSGQQQLAVMQRERTTAQFGVRRRRSCEQPLTHPTSPPANSGRALTDASGAKSLKVKERR